MMVHVVHDIKQSAAQGAAVWQGADGSYPDAVSQVSEVSEVCKASTTYHSI